MVGDRARLWSPSRELGDQEERHNLSDMLVFTLHEDLH
jgi:hypothetical protein